MPNDTVLDEQTDDEQAALDRQHEQLFHELRAIIPGAEVLFAFLLTGVLTERFERLSTHQHAVYYATFLTAAVALVLLLAPSSFHRLRFRQNDKETMLRAANVEVIAALALLSLAVAGAVFLITDVLWSVTWAATVAIIVLLATAALWWAYPLSRRRRDR